MNYVQSGSGSSWQFTNIPEFPYGKMHPLFADCGCGLEISGEINPGKHSFMHTFRNTTESNVREYADILGQSFGKIYEYRSGGNLFFQFDVSEGLLYISFFGNTGITRIILDRCLTERASGFGYSRFKEVRQDTVFSQYSLHYDSMIRGTTCDCGMNYVYRLRDNSLIIIDGGQMEQSTDTAVNDYMCFLRELTGTGKNEPLRISLWLCTHPHNDHCDFFSKMIRFHSGEIQLERVAFNFPNPSNVRHSPSVFIIRDRILQKYPDVKFLKLHSGQVFHVANAKAEILTAQEDVLGNNPDDNFPGTNETSCIFKITADGISTLFLADCGWDNGDFLINNYSKEALKCSFLQAAHHGINSIYEVYEYVDADTVLLPQCRMNMDTRFSENLSHLCSRYSEKNVLFAADFSDIFTLKNGVYERKTRAHSGTAWDKSEW